MKKIMVIVLSVLMAFSVMPMAFAQDAHNCVDADNCLVCYIAELINSLPEAKDISAENAAEVTDTIHAVDCVKFELTDEEYDELLSLVAAAENSNGGLPVPKAYMEALNAIVNLDDGCSFHISKDVLLKGEDIYDLSEAYVAFEITGENGYCSTLTLRDAVQGVFTLDESQVASVDFFTATLASFEGYYTMDKQGWTYSYTLPAGTYTIKEVTDSMIINGTEYTDATVSFNGESAESYTFILKEGEDVSLLIGNYYDGEINIWYEANGGEGEMYPDIATRYNEFTLSPNAFTKTGYVFKGWSDDIGNSYDDGGTYYFDNSTTLFAQWEECTEHIWSDGTCSKCGTECSHDTMTSEITARPESSDGISWSKGEKTYTCTCGYSYAQEADRADYSEYIKAALEFAELASTEGLTDTAKISIAADYADLGELAQNLITDEQKIVDDYVAGLKALIEKIKAGIADGSYLKADYTELEVAIDELEKVLAENEALLTEKAVQELKDAIADAESTDKNLTKSAQDTAILDAAVKAAKDAAVLDDSDFRVDTTEAEKLIVELEEKEIADEALKAEIENIKAEIEKIKADKNASKAEYDEVVGGYVNRLQEIKSVINNEDEFRCGMCDTYEKNADTPVIGIIMKIIHFFVHFAQLISFKS
ncbi:MAG: InlB B-repeat-containing protein [Clostridia bacterium]|nr:InlB B-repeat-containing protein [Clostridia bacterium]